MTKLQKEIFLKSELILLSSSYSKKDLYEIENIIKNLISLNKTIIIASHDINIVKSVADKLILLDSGRVAFDGTPSNFFKI